MPGRGRVAAAECLERGASMIHLLVRAQIATTGKNTQPVMVPSHQFIRMSNATTTTKVTTLVMKKMTPNPANRLIADRSVVALDSN